MSGSDKKKDVPERWTHSSGTCGFLGGKMVSPGGFGQSPP
jgi:hypothetical protein